MIWSAIFMIVGLAVIGMGGLFTLSFFMPKFGGGSETGGTLIFGLFLTVLGVGLIFYAGVLT